MRKKLDGIRLNKYESVLYTLRDIPIRTRRTIVLDWALEAENIFLVHYADVILTFIIMVLFWPLVFEKWH